MNSLKPGDRVRVYQGVQTRTGKVLYTHDDGCVWVEFGRETCDQAKGGLFISIGALFHPYQLRRIKKRERRRVWISDANLRLVESLSGLDAIKISVWNGKPESLDSVEFVEVPKGSKR